MRNQTSQKTAAEQHQKAVGYLPVQDDAIMNALTTFPTAIMQALDDADIETLQKWLIEHDIDLQDEMGYTLLIHASQRRCYGIGRWLVAQGANISLKMKHGYNALNLAYFAGEIAMGAYSKETLDFAAFLKARLKEG